MAAVETPAVMPPTPTQRTPAVNITEDFVYRLAKLEAAQELRHSQLLEKIDQQTAFFKSMFTRIFETLQADSNHNSPEEYLNADERSHKIIGDEHMYEYADENCIPSDSDNSPPDAITAEKGIRSLTVDTNPQPRRRKIMSARPSRPSRGQMLRKPRRSLPASLRPPSLSELNDPPPNSPNQLMRSPSVPVYLDESPQNSPAMTRRVQYSHDSDQTHSKSSRSLRQSQTPRANNRSKTPRSGHKAQKESGNNRFKEKTPRNARSPLNGDTGSSPLAGSSKRSPTRRFKNATRMVMAANRLKQEVETPHLMEAAAVKQYKKGEVKITIPEGATSETVLRCHWNGTSFRCHIPPGRGPGDKFLVKLS